MAQHPKLVTIFGGSGFVGRYIARRLAKQGFRVRVAVRRPNEAMFVKPYGSVGQVEPILANIRDEASTRAAIAGSDVVINCVAVMIESGKQTFQSVHMDGAERIARLAAQEGVSNLVHLSALGADHGSESLAAQSRAKAEDLVSAAFPNATILRPSIIFGNEDAFFNRFASMARFGPILPVFGGNSKFQPVFVDDVAQAAVVAATGKAEAGVYELGGPETASLVDLMHKMLHVIRRRRLVVNVPFFIGRMMGWSFDLLQTLTAGLFQNTILTKDQVRQLRCDNVVSEGAKTFADLGIEPTAMEPVMRDYLYQYRPQGQYTELTESAQNLPGSKAGSEF